LSSRAMTAEERASGALPWELQWRFQNVILSLPEAEARARRSTGDRYLVVNEVTKSVFIAGSSTFLYVPRVEYEKQDYPERGELVVKVADGLVGGRLPDGDKVWYSASTALKVRAEAGEPAGEIKVRYSGEYSDWMVDAVVRDHLRLSASPLMAARVKEFAKRHGITFARLEGKREIEVLIEAKTVRTTIKLETHAYLMKDGSGRAQTVPGVVPGVLRAISSRRLKPLEDYPDAEQALQDFMKDVASVGEKLVPVSAVLQGTHKTRFTYIAGEADGSEGRFNRVKEKLESQGRKLLWLGGTRLSRGVWGSFNFDPESRKVLFSVHIEPDSPPATVVLNYPPFNLTPIAAVAYEKPEALTKGVRESARRLGAYGLSVASYADDYEVLADAKITFNDVRRVVLEGYPRLGTLRRLLEKVEALGTVGDVMSLAYGKETVVDEMMIKQLAPQRRRERREEEEVTL